MGVHKALVACALPVSIYVLVRTRPGPVRTRFFIMFLMGAALLIAGAFVPAWQEHEVLLTISGAIMFAAAHLSRWGGGVYL